MPSPKGIPIPEAKAFRLDERIYDSRQTKGWMSNDERQVATHSGSVLPGALAKRVFERVPSLRLPPPITKLYWSLWASSSSSERTSSARPVAIMRTATLMMR